MITSTLSFYPAKSLSETVRFYTEIIGLTAVMDEERQCVFASPKGHIGFVDYGDGILAEGHICISFNCESREDVDAEYPVRTAPAKHPSFPVYSFFLEDPNGYTVEFQKIDGLSI